jgi:hypothetical protein
MQKEQIYMYMLLQKNPVKWPDSFLDHDQSLPPVS